MIPQGGGPPPDPSQGGGQDPDELLAQIRDLLDQYLALGQGTPVEAEAQALADAIDAGGTPPPGEENQAEPEGPPTDFGSASKAALSDLANGGPASKAQEVQTKKKKTKAY
jgi:hypothetical protein